MLFSQVNCDTRTLVIGPDVSKNLVIRYPERLTIGNGTTINGDCLINAQGGVRIGEHCHIAKGLTLYSSIHNYEKPTKIPYDEVIIMKTVSIGDYVWVGANVTIVPGATIGEGAVVGMGAVVVGDVPDCAVVGGNPARVIKYRDRQRFNELKQEGRFH